MFLRGSFQVAVRRFTAAFRADAGLRVLSRPDVRRLNAGIS
jgi:hypothetical protein